MSRLVLGIDAAYGADHGAAVLLHVGEDGAAIARVIRPTRERTERTFRELVTAFENMGAAARSAGAIIRWFGFVTYRHQRPDGRPRRSGRRHRGTDAWQRRSGIQ